MRIASRTAARLTAAGLVAAAAPANAQRLPYEPVWPIDSLPAPRLAYQVVEPDEAPVVSAPDAGGAGKPEWLQYALLDRFEWAAQRGRDGYAWDFSASLGGERNRLWLASVGEGSAGGALDYLELQALYSRAVGSGWEVQGGLRHDAIPEPRRTYLTVGAQLDREPLWMGAWAYLSHEGEASARFAAYYNWPITGRLYLQPSFELEAYGQDIPALGVGRGLSYTEAGLRLRYEVVKHLAPYVGLSWSRDLGRTARFDRAAGEDPETKSLVLGLRSAF
jgi:copper resistance protein B